MLRTCEPPLECPELTAHETVTLWNTYALTRKRGIIRLPVEAGENQQQASGGNRQQSNGDWSGTFTVTNPEDGPILFTISQITLQPCDPDAELIQLPEEAIALEVPGGQQVTQEVLVPAGQLSDDICGVEASLAGQDQWKHPAHTSAYFTIRHNPAMVRPVDDEALRQVLNQVAGEEGWVEDPLHITVEDLYRLAREGKIVYPPPPVTPGEAEQSTSLVDSQEEESTSEPPPIFHQRRIQIDGTATIKDDEGAYEDEVGTWDFVESVTLDKDNPDEEIHIARCVGEEVVAEIYFKFKLHDDGTTIIVSPGTNELGDEGNLFLYEGDECWSVDPVDSYSYGEKVVSKDGTLPIDHKLSWYQGDEADFNFFLRNMNESCLPGDIPPQDGYVCQATGEWEESSTPRINNALKGDIILSAGCGLVGNMLRKLEPRQVYTHTGIMTRSFFEITHTTSVEDRYEDHNQSGSGFVEDVLKYGWPGVITQSVDQAFNGEWLMDPYINSYFYEGFVADPVSCDGDEGALVYPLVVKPPPGSHPDVRKTLWKAADIARDFQNRYGGTHYRFYAYSDADIIDDDDKKAPPDAGWAEGTLPAVCSQFVWYCVREGIAQAIADAEIESMDNTQLEGWHSEQTDPKVSCGSLPFYRDGLYCYSEKERESAAEETFQNIYDKVFNRVKDMGHSDDTAKWAGQNLGSQFVNCFIEDCCDDGDCTEYKSWRSPSFPGKGLAVSPQDILNWDEPSKNDPENPDPYSNHGGVYGDAQPLIYTGGGFDGVMTWQEGPGGFGTISGTVTYEHNDESVPGATVLIADVELVTDGDGEFKYNYIPSGKYYIWAYIVPGDGGYYYESEKRLVTIEKDEEKQCELLLKSDENRRRINITGTIKMCDEESTNQSECCREGEDFVISDDLTFAALLEPYSPNEYISFDKCHGGEVVVRGYYDNVETDEGELQDNVAFQLKLQEESLAVDIHVGFTLFEGTSCFTEDDEDTLDDAFSLPPGCVLWVDYLYPNDIDCEGNEHSLLNDEPAGGDWVDISLKFENSRETFPRLKVTYPNKRETLTRGQQYEITWESTGIGENETIIINLIQRDAENPVAELARVSNSGSNSWTVSEDLTPGFYKIQLISAVGAPATLDESDTYFRIKE